ncbi:MAG: GNAT family N-acetyltransferase [Verrucomicrobiota bacterium]
MHSWVCFEWDVATADLAVRTPTPLVVRGAERDEEKTVSKVVRTAFSMDSAWGDISRRLDEAMEKFVDEAFDKSQGSPACVVALHGPRIIGVSVLEADPDSPNHLVSGPMILHEYRNRGLGTALLAASLDFLRGKGLAKVRGVTRANSTAARFIYTKFSGHPIPYSLDPLPAPAR